METKTCISCLLSKNLDAFSFRHKERQILHNSCKECKREYTKQHYRNNADKYKKLAKKFKQEYREQRRNYLFEFLKSHPCIDCGEKDPIVLQFDHVTGSKVDHVTSMAYECYSFESVKNEIEKCQVRCANCHIKRHAKKNETFKWKKSLVKGENS